MKRERAIPELLRPLLWDVDWGCLNLGEHWEFIVERVLNMGDGVALRWLSETFTDDEILHVVKTSRRLSKKTARCWQNVFDLQEEEMRCFGTYLMSPDNYYSKS